MVLKVAKCVQNKPHLLLVEWHGSIANLYQNYY